MALDPIKVVLEGIDKISQPLSAIAAQAKATEQKIQQVVTSAKSLKAAMAGAFNKGNSNELAKALDISVRQANALSKALKLSTQDAVALANAYKKVQESGGSKSDRFAALRKETGASKEQFESLEKASQKVGDTTKRTHEAGAKNVKEHGLGVGQLATAFGGAMIAVQLFKQVAQQSFESLIGQNVKLRAQILGTATQLASIQDVTKNGVVIKDPLEAVKAAQAPIQAQIDKLRVDATALSGVTSNDLIPSFQSVVKASGSLRLNLDQSREITTRLTAQGLTLGLSAEQIQGDVAGIAAGTIDSYNALAKSVGLSNERVAQLASEGKLMDYIAKKTEAGVKGQELLSKTWEGVTSNIQEYIELATQAAGAPILDALLKPLSQIEGLIKGNLDNLKNFGAEYGGRFSEIISEVVDATAIALGTFGSGVGDNSKSFKSFVDTVLDGILLIAKALTAIAPAMRGLGQFLGAAMNDLMVGIEVTRNSFAKFISLLSKVPGMGKFLGDPIRDAAEASAALDGKTANTTATVKKLLEDIGNLRQKDGKFSAENAKKAKKLSEEQITALDQQLSQERQFIPLSKAQKTAHEQRLAQMEGQRAALQKNLELAQKDNKEIGFQNKKLDNKGSIFDQLEQKAKAFSNNLKNPLDLNQAASAAKSLLDVTKQQSELGAISKKDAIARLTAIGNDSRLEVETRRSAQEAVTALKKQSDDQDIAQVKKREAAVSLLVASGQKSEIQGEQELTKLKQEEATKRLSVLQSSLAREKKEGRGKGDRAQELINEIAEAESAVASAGKAVRDGAFKKKLQDVDEQQSILQGRQAQGLVSEEAFNEQSLKLDLKRSEVELKNIAQARSRLSKTDKEGLEALAAQESEIYVKRTAALERFDQRQIQMLERRQRQALDIAKQSELERDSSTQQLMNARLMRQTDAEIKGLKSKRSTLEQEVELEQEKTAFLDKLPKYNDPIKEADRQDKVRASRIRATELVKSLLDNEFQQQQAHYSKIEELINRQQQQAKNAMQAAIEPLERQQILQDALTKSMDNQTKILEARKSLLSAAGSYLEQELNILSQTAVTEKEKRQLARETADIKLRSLKIQQDMERQILELNLKQQEAALKQEQIANRIAQIKNASEQAQAEADLRRVQAQPDATPEEIDAAVLNVRAKQAEGLGLQLTDAQLEDKGKIQSQLGQAQRDTMDMQQQSQSDQARLEYIQAQSPVRQQQGMRNLRGELRDRLFSQGQVRSFGSEGEGLRFQESEKTQALTKQLEALTQDKYKPSNDPSLRVQEAIETQKLKGMIAAARSGRSGAESSDSSPQQVQNRINRAVQSVPGKPLSAAAPKVMPIGVPLSATAATSVAPESGMLGKISSDLIRLMALIKQQGGVKQENTVEIHNHGGGAVTRNSQGDNQAVINGLYDLGLIAKRLQK